ncbi:MAG: phage portal protein [Nitrospinae bacterium]|nr:phage portal protein [Nitrospinota bacterium]
MSVLKWFRKASATARALTLYFPPAQGFALRRNYESYAREGYLENSVVYACIREIAEASAGVPWFLSRRREDGAMEEVADHPVLRLIERPNPLQGQFEFFEYVIAFLYLSGNAYIESAGPEGGSRAPRELYVLRPDRMSILPDPVNLVAGYEYKVGGETARLPKERVLHLKLFNPLDDWYGLSPVQVAALPIDKMNGGDRWNAALLRNAAVPSGALVSKQNLTDEQFKRLEGELRDKYQGAVNARKPLLLEGDLDWKEIGVSPKDMDWVEGLKFSALQIAQIYNVPPELIGLQPATHQNRKEARKALYTEVVLPALRRLRDALNVWLVPQFAGESPAGENLFLDFDADQVEALSEDREALWNRANQNTFLTVNEKRQMVGYPAVPDGDVVLALVSQASPGQNKEKRNG